MISTQILTTKLYPPPPRASLVARPRLVERLNAGLQAGRQLILVSAAAGFGKTTLASEWIAGGQMNRSVAWVSLDEEDNRPNRFLFYLIAALQQVNPQFGENLIPVLQSHQLPPLSELVEQLINQIAASEEKVLLILDDYHLITSDAVHPIVQRIIERQPSQMHTVILTREDPPLPLPRMRVRGQLIEIRERDLRFTLAEARSFLVEAMRLDLSTDEVGKLKERTEGWVAGMQLAALALEDYPDEEDRRSFIDAFTGSDRFIVDYLMSEVLERQPEPVREFLLLSSILQRFCAELCDEVIYGKAGAGKSQSILDSLEQGNMFLVPLDNQRLWYRYHHLFAEMLRHYLQRSAPDRAPELLRRASLWFEARGSISEAVKNATAYAAASGDWDFAGALLDQYAMRMLLQGQVSLVIGWCQALPKTFLERAPEVSIYYAWALMLTYRNDYLDAIEEKLQLAVKAIESADLPAQARIGQDGALVPLRDWVTGQICVIRSQILLGRFQSYVDPQDLIYLSLTGLELLPEEEKAIRGICRINIAHAQTLQNKPLEAQRAFDEALPYMLEAKNYLGGVTCIFYQARLNYYLGQLDYAEALCRQWKEKFAATAGPRQHDFPAIRGLDIVLSILLLERGQVDEAERLLVKALDLPGWASWMEIIGFIALARLRCLCGDYNGANETLNRMTGLGPQHASCADALHILFAIRNSPNDPLLRAKAETWVKSMAPNLGAPFALGIGPYHCDVEYFCNLAWAQIQTALGHPMEALKFVEPALASAKEHQLAYRILELTLARALIYQASGDLASALEMLDQALEIAETYGYIQVFIEGPDTKGLLQKAAEQNRHQKLVRRLLALADEMHTRKKAVEMGQTTLDNAALQEPTLPGKLGAGIQPVAVKEPAVLIEPAALIEPAVLIEPLSERELEVLRLIASGLSNAMIAKQLYIAEGTVKRHITNIYGKLAVQSRTQAMVKAREIGLL